MHLRPKRGFTLIEMLIVVAIIAILAATVIVAINPGRQFQQVRNTQRWTAANSILDAVHQNMIDNNGVFVCAAGSIPTTATDMADTTTVPAGYDICACLVDAGYIGSLPYDPSNGSYTSCTTYDTDYEISQDAITLHITVSAPDAEGETISITR